MTKYPPGSSVRLLQEDQIYTVLSPNSPEVIERANYLLLSRNMNDERMRAWRESFIWVMGKDHPGGWYPDQLELVMSVCGGCEGVMTYRDDYLCDECRQ